MNKLVLIGALALSAQFTVAKPVGEFAIANRGGSVSFFDYDRSTQELNFQEDLQSTQVQEPMYVTPLGTSSGQRLIAFADRTKNTLSIINANTKSIISQIAISNGAFHQFSHPLIGPMIAVATDIDKGMDIITFKDGGRSLSRRHFALPKNFAAGNPHDVVMDKEFAYLTVKGIQDQNEKYDALLQISLRSLDIVNFKKFSEDIHLFNPVKADSFVVVEEETGILHTIQQGTMNTISQIKIAQGIHGISGSEDGKFLFTLDINEPVGGKAVYAIERTGTNLKVVDTAALNFPVAHNIAVDDRSDKLTLVVTHSGGSQTNNSVLNFSTETKKLNLEKEISTGINPFGLTFF